jgi:hypothetical protein
MKKVKCAVLSDCGYGSHGEVIEVDAEVAKNAVQLDPAPAAVAYFEAQIKAKQAAAKEPAGTDGSGNAQIQPE